MTTWKKCPVDGTPFFHATTEFPLGRPAGALFCGADCAARANHPEARGLSAPFYTPEVDGTLGSATERGQGGPVHFHGFDVRPRREFVSFPSDGVTARPKGGGDLGEYHDLVEGNGTLTRRGNRT